MVRTAIALLSYVLLTAGTPLVRYEYSEPHMGTLVRLVLYAPSESVAAEASRAAFDRIAALDAALSDYREASESMRLSAQAGAGPIAVSEDLFRVLRASQEIARASGGAFDVTVGPLSVVWRQAHRLGELPDPQRVAAARARVGYGLMEIDERRRTVRLREPGMQLDLGGIAKGFAADEATAVLAARGVTRALVAAGGDIVAGDAPPAERGWRVAVAPLDGVSAADVWLTHAAISTSGDAEQFLAVAGVRYSHIFDPRTGAPLTGRRSVTVVARRGMQSDALATAVSVMGPEAGLRLVEATEGAAALIAADTGGAVRTYQSSRWK